MTAAMSSPVTLNSFKNNITHTEESKCKNNFSLSDDELDLNGSTPEQIDMEPEDEYFNKLDKIDSCFSIKQRSSVNSKKPKLNGVNDYGQDKDHVDKTEDKILNKLDVQASRPSAKCKTIEEGGLSKNNEKVGIDRNLEQHQINGYVNNVDSNNEQSNICDNTIKEVCSVTSNIDAEDNSDDFQSEQNNDKSDNGDHVNSDCEDLMDVSVVKDMNEDNAENDLKALEVCNDATECDDINVENESFTSEYDIGSEDYSEEVSSQNLKRNVDTQFSTCSDKISTEISIEEKSILHPDESLMEPSSSTLKDDRLCDNEVNNKEDANLDSANITNIGHLTSSIDNSSVCNKHDNVQEREETCLRSKRSNSEEDDDDVSRKKLKFKADGSSDIASSLPLLREFLQNILTSNTSQITFADVEQFCLQKLGELVVHQSQVAELCHKLKLYQKANETMRKELAALSKQAKDLEIVNKKLMYDLRQQTVHQKSIQPLKIIRSVGLQVKLAPDSFDNAVTLIRTNIHSNKNINSHSNNNSTIKQISPLPPVIITNVSSSSTQSLVTASSPAANSLNSISTSPSTSTSTIVLTTTNSTARQSLLSQTLVSSPRKAIAINTPSSNTTDANATDARSGVIDLTDEDEKKSLSDLKSPLTVHPTFTPIRFTTPNGKITPITSVVNSASQVMYVVQSPSNGAGSQPKTVLVNFQPTNSVLNTTQLNGQSVSVLSTKPLTSNTVLKSVSLNKPITTVSPRVLKHPAPLPSPPITRSPSDTLLKPIPPKPTLSIRKIDSGIILQWKMPYDLTQYEAIVSYQLYAYQETLANPQTSMWRRVGDVKALALPMACTLTQFAEKNRYHFAVRPVDIHKRIGPFSNAEMIDL